LSLSLNFKTMCPMCLYGKPSKKHPYNTFEFEFEFELEF